jgi:hypothetical protein
MSSNGRAFSGFVKRSPQPSTSWSKEHDKDEWTMHRSACARTLGEAVLKFLDADVLFDLQDITNIVLENGMRIPASSLDRVVPANTLTKAILDNRCMDALSYLVGEGHLRRVTQPDGLRKKPTTFWTISNLRTKYGR